LMTILDSAGSQWKLGEDKSIKDRPGNNTNVFVLQPESFVLLGTRPFTIQL
jgi:hypothetical protein